MFRPEVAQAKQQAWLGEIQLAVPASSNIGFALALVFSIAAAATLWFGQYTSRERVPGKIVPTKGIIKVTDTLPGVITNIYVREGQAVHAGERLVEISGEQQSTALGATRSQVIEQLRSERERLKAELASTTEAVGFQKFSLSEKIKGLHSQRSAIQAQIDIAQKEADTADHLLAQMRPFYSTHL